MRRVRSPYGIGVLACCAALALIGSDRRAASPSSVILIVVDTLRADHLGTYGYERPTSPKLDAWAQDAAVFEYAFSTSPWTLPSFGTLFTGQLPSRHLAGTFDHGADNRPPDRSQFRQLDASLLTLAEVATAAGFATAAVVNNAFLGPRFGVDRGFATYDFSPAGNRKLRRADVVVDRALEWLRHHQEAPFFLVVHMFDPHMNYDPPDATRGFFSSQLPATGLPRITERIRATLRQGGELDRDYLIALYDEEILFVDSQLGRLFESLDADGLGDDAVVVLTSDHGEELFDHDGFEHGHTVYNELLRVPMVVRGPGIRPARHGMPVSLLDVYPTVVAAFGQAGSGALPGRSLWPVLSEAAGSLPRRPAFAERTLYGVEHQAIIDWPYKLIRRAGVHADQLFDLEADWNERHDVTTTRAAEVTRLRDGLSAVMADAADPDAGEDAELDESTLDTLRALGYIR